MLKNLCKYYYIYNIFIKYWRMTFKTCLCLFSYKVMCRCWMLDPVDRPCFSKLVAFMEKELAALEERVTFM